MLKVLYCCVVKYEGYTTVRWVAFEFYVYTMSEALYLLILL